MKNEHQDVIDDVIESLLYAPPSIGGRVGVLIDQGSDATGASASPLVEFGDIVGWATPPEDHMGPACRALRVGGQEVARILTEEGAERWGCDHFWSTERKMRRWLERKADGRH